MPAIAAISINDSVPAAQSFTPLNLDSTGVARYGTSAAVFDAKSIITHSVSLPKNGSTVTRVKQKIVIPIMDTVDTTKKVAEAFANIEYVLPKNASALVLANLQAYVKNLAAHAVTTAAVGSFENVY